MANNPTLSPASADDNRLLSINQKPSVELQNQNRSRRFTGSSRRSINKEIENEPINDYSSVISIDMLYSNASSSDELPYYPLLLSFNNLSYSVKVGQKLLPPLPFFGSQDDVKKTKLLLDDISGVAREGEITAILGGSGSSKTTLMDAIAGRISRQRLKGTVTLNGEVLGSKLLKIISAYVMQDDLLYSMLTIEETLMFSAEFRLPRSFSKEKKQKRVDALIDQLGLRSAAKTIIGDEQHRGVSGGERRRVSIGVDIIHDPILLFLDEPTSGLDSTSAFNVVKVLKQIAKSGSIVIMSIHQPSHRILRILDRLIFLSNGQAVCSEAPSNLSQFFGAFGHRIPENENQAEFALDLIRALEDSPGGISTLVEFNKSRQYSKRDLDEPKYELKEAIKASIVKGKLVTTGTASKDDDTGSDLTSSVQNYANPFWVEMMILSKRLIINSRRMPELFGVRFASVFVAAIIVAGLYWQLDNSPKGTQGRLGFFGFGITLIFFQCSQEIPVFLQERNIFIRETAYNAYRVSSYLLAHSLVPIPSMIILSLVFTATTFWAVGLAGGFSGFLFFFIIICVSFWVGSSFIALISGLVSHVMVGFIIVACLLGYFLVFSGAYLPRHQMRSIWVLLHYTSLVKYPFQSVLQNEYGDDSSKCFIRGVQFFDDTTFVQLSESMKIKLLKSMGHVLGKNITGSTCLANGGKILEHSGATDISKWNCFWITVGFGVLFRVLFYFVLLLGSKNKRM